MFAGVSLVRVVPEMLPENGCIYIYIIYIIYIYKQVDQHGCHSPRD